MFGLRAATVATTFVAGRPIVARPHEVRQEFDRQRKDYGRILLGRDAVERLQIAQLHRRGRFIDDIGRLAKSMSCLVLALGRDHLEDKERNTSVARGFGAVTSFGESTVSIVSFAE